MNFFYVFSVKVNYASWVSGFLTEPFLSNDKRKCISRISTYKMIPCLLKVKKDYYSKVVAFLEIRKKKP